MGSNTKPRTAFLLFALAALAVIAGFGMIAYAIASSAQAPQDGPPIESAGRFMLAVGGGICVFGGMMSAICAAQNAGVEP